jgi:hypothetical protein
MTVYNGTRKGLNVTVVGNPTINGTVVSGFSKTNYVRTPEPLPTINYLNRFAVQLSVVFTNPSTITEIISGDETTFLLRANKNKLCLFASSNGTSWDIADQVYGTYTLQAGVKYFITVQLENGVVSVLIRAEGEPASTRDISITFTTKKPDLSGKYIYFGWFNRTYFPGLTVDLKDCYYQIRYTTKWRAYDDMPRKIEDIYYSGPKKYWKEATTSTEVEKEVLGYACYRQDKYVTPNIYYVKPPLGEDTVIYAYGYGFEYAPDYDSVTPLIAQGETEPAHFISVTEDTLNITGISAESVDSLVRQKDHDIYHMATVTETTTEIVEGTKEGHTYSEPDVKQILSIHKPTGNTEPNATVVGNPTITDNVVSGISLGNFLTMPEVFNPSDNSWEIVIRAKTAATRSHRDWLIGSGNTAGQDYGYITMGLENNGKPLLYLSSNGSSWNIASAVAGSTILDTDTYYLFRLRFIRVEITGAVYIYDISSDNGQSWTEEIRIDSTYSVFVPTIPYAIGISYYSRSPNQFWAGSIDFSQSYIKINGKYWWKGTKPEYALLYNKNISLLKAEDFNSIKESSSGVAIWGGDAISTGSQGGGIRNLNQQDSITFNKSLPAGKYTVTFNYYSQVNFRMHLVQFTATYEDGTTEVVYSNTSLGDTAYGGGEKADVTTTMTFNKRIKGITTLAQGSGNGNGCYGGFGKVRMSLSGAQQ